MKKRILFVFIFLGLCPLSFLFGQQPAEYVLADANDYFKSGRYFDAFFKYREAAQLPEYHDNFEVISQIKNSSHALYLRKKYIDYHGFRKFDLAKKNLVELVDLNPSDPDRDQIPRLTLKQAEELQRMAWRQRSSRTTSEMLQKAIAYYHQAIREGLSRKSIETAIRLCEHSIQQTGVDAQQPNTTYGTNEKPEREREVKIIEE